MMDVVVSNWRLIRNYKSWMIVLSQKKFVFLKKNGQKRPRLCTFFMEVSCQKTRSADFSNILINNMQT